MPADLLDHLVHHLGQLRGAPRQRGGDLSGGGEGVQLRHGGRHGVQNAAAPAGQQFQTRRVQLGQGVGQTGGGVQPRLVHLAAPMRACQQRELVDQGVQVDHRTAVEDADDPVIAQHLLETAVLEGVPEQQGPRSHQPGQPAECLFRQGRDQELGHRRDGRQLAGQGVQGPGREHRQGLGGQQVGVRAGEQAPRLRQFDQGRAVVVPGERVSRRHVQGLVERAERECRAQDAGELEALQHDLQTVAFGADQCGPVDLGPGERHTADVRAADAVQPGRREGAEAPRLQPAFVDHEDAEPARAALGCGAGQYADQVAPGGVVDQPLLTGHAVPAGGALRAHLPREEIAPVLPLGQAPGHGGAPEHLGAQFPALPGIPGDPHRSGAEERLAVRDGDREVAAGDAPHDLQGVLEGTHRSAVGDGHVVRGEPEQVQLPADLQRELLTLVQHEGARVGEQPARVAGVAQQVVELLRDAIRGVPHAASPGAAVAPSASPAR